MRQRGLPEAAVQAPVSATDPLPVHTPVVQVEVVYMQSASNTEDCCDVHNFDSEHDVVFAR